MLTSHELISQQKGRISCKRGHIPEEKDNLISNRSQEQPDLYIILAHKAGKWRVKVQSEKVGVKGQLGMKERQRQTERGRERHREKERDRER